MKKVILSISALACLMIILNSCTINNAGTVATQQGYFLIAQASPDAPGLNVAINGGLVDTGFNYKTYTRYINVNPGTYNFSIIPDSSGNAISDSNTVAVNIDANKDYSLFYIDSFKTVTTALVNDVFRAPSGDSVYIRYFNFCPNLPVPVDLINAAGSVALSQNRTFNDQAYNAQNSLFTELPAGTYTLKLQTSTSDSLLKTQTVTLTGGKVYTLIIKGLYKNTSSDTTKSLALGLLENYPQTNATFRF